MKTTPVETWFTMQRWRVLEAASQRKLYRAFGGSNPDFYQYAYAGSMRQGLRYTAREFLRRGLLEVSRESNTRGYLTVPTEYGWRLRNRWMESEARLLPFPYPGLIDPPRHSFEHHLVLWNAKHRKSLSDKATPHASYALLLSAGLDMTKRGLLHHAGAGHFVHTVSTDPLLLAWSRLPRTQCTCSKYGID